MGKNLVSLSAITLFALTLALAGCEKKETVVTPPPPPPAPAAPAPAGPEGAPGLLELPERLGLPVRLVHPLRMRQWRRKKKGKPSKGF